MGGGLSREAENHNEVKQRETAVHLSCYIPRPIHEVQRQKMKHHTAPIQSHNVLVVCDGPVSTSATMIHLDKTQMLKLTTRLRLQMTHEYNMMSKVSDLPISHNRQLIGCAINSSFTSGCLQAYSSGT